MSDARGPTDEESAPLLAGNNDEEQSPFARFNTLIQEPLTSLTKALLGVVLFLLILVSVFIGLFAGAEHRLSSRAPEHENNKTVTFSTTFVSTTTEHRVTTTAPSVPGPTSDPREGTCLSSDCIVLSAAILSSMDVSQDPCENFYEFCNGGWIKGNPLPADKGVFGSFEEVTTENQRIIQQILAENSTSYSSPDAQTLTKLQDLFQSCLDEDNLNNIGIKPLTDVVDKIKELYNESRTAIDASPPAMQYPLSVGSTNGKKGLTAAVAYLHSLGVEALFSFDVDGDVGVDPNHMTLWFNQPGLGLPSKEYFEEESITALYTSVIARMFRALKGKDGENVSPTRNWWQFWPPFPWPPWGDDDEPEDRKKTAKELAEAVFQFERKIARAELDLDKLQQDPFGTYNPMTFSNFSASIPELDFPTYWSTYAPRSFPERVIVTYPDYLSSLSSILSNTSSDVLEGYLVVRASLSLADYLGSGTQIWKANRALTEELKGIKKGAVGDRAEYCAGKVEEALGFAAGRFFVLETFGGESQQKAIRVIKDVIGTFRKSLKKLDWMDKTSAKAAAEKASAIRVKVGYPLSPNTTDPQAIAKYYSRVKIDKNHFFGNMIRSSTFKKTLTWSKLGKQRNIEEWEMIPSQVNAYFNPPSNEIVFPAGILRPPFFSQKWPNYVKYGAFGAVAAHELTHAFDSAGRLYDQEGKLREWWTNSTSESFEAIRSCISRQYSKYMIDDGKGGHIHVNGNLTSGENIGDSGLIQAYRAWKSQYSTSLDGDSEYLLPGLNYTRDQLFFISFGRVWAQNIKPQTAVQRVRVDPHSPNKYRVEGTLVNMDSSTFAAAFNCPKGSKLNPPDEQRCKLW